jgi:TonB family protein
MFLGILLWLLVTSQTQVPPAPSDDLAAARSLYAAGDYETALTRLESARTDHHTADEVDQYRALCLLALGRIDETEKALRDLVDRRPGFRMSEDDVSPRLIAMFHTVRRQLLPGIVRALYARAKTTFEEKRFADAVSALREVVELIDDADLVDEAASLADLKMVSQGFLRLAELEVEKERAAAEAAARAAPAAAAPQPQPAAPPAPEVYSEQDVEVTPPVALSRPIPPWRPTSASVGERTYQGHLRVVVDETGRVESAAIVRPFLPGYEELLLEAAKTWQFTPATRNGVAVKYVRIFTIDVSPR